MRHNDKILNKKIPVFWEVFRKLAERIGLEPMHGFNTMTD